MNKELEQQARGWYEAEERKRLASVLDTNGDPMFDEETISVASAANARSLAPRLAAFVAHLEAQSKPIQGEVDGWISVANELPPIHEDDREDGFVLLLMLCASWKPDTWKTINGSRVFGDYDEEGNALWFWADEDGDPIDDDGLLITYWQPIPPPPVSASPQ